MAGVNLPNVEGMTSLADLKNAVGKMTKELSWLLNNLDTRNLNYVDGDLLVEGTVTALKLQVEELSAISANLGHITAGLIESIEIFSSYFGTRNGEYPVCDIDSVTNRIRSAYSETDYISLEPAFGGSPGLFMTTRLNDTGITSDADTLYISTTRDMTIESNIGSISIKVPMGVLQFENFYKIYDLSSSQSLQQKLDNLHNSIYSLASAVSGLETRVSSLESA